MQIGQIIVRIPERISIDFAQYEVPSPKRRSSGCAIAGSIDNHAHPHNRGAMEWVRQRRSGWDIHPTRPNQFTPALAGAAQAIPSPPIPTARCHGTAAKPAAIAVVVAIVEPEFDAWPPGVPSPASITLGWPSRARARDTISFTPAFAKRGSAAAGCATITTATRGIAAGCAAVTTTARSFAVACAATTTGTYGSAAPIAAATCRAPTATVTAAAGGRLSQFYRCVPGFSRTLRCPRSGWRKCQCKRRQRRHECQGTFMHNRHLSHVLLSALPHAGTVVSRASVSA